MQHFVKMIDGKSMLIRVSYLATVLDVIKVVETKTMLLVSKQRLIHGRRQLRDEYVLNDCGIRNDSILLVVARIAYCEKWREIENINHIMRKLLCSKEPDCRLSDTLKLGIGDMVAKFSNYERIE